MTVAQANTAVRRLSPRECERLQGFPDDWCAVGNYDGVIKPISDSARYRMLGNAVNVVVSTWLGARVAAVMLGRRAIGIELKPSYYRQAVKNAHAAERGDKDLILNEVLDFEDFDIGDTDSDEYLIDEPEEALA